jgi:hypothetical protein
MLAKAADVYQLGAFSKQIQTELQGDIVDSYARLYASDTKQIESLRNKKKTNMQRRALLNAMKTKIGK